MVVEPIDPGLGVLVERRGGRPEDRSVGVVLVIALQGHPDRLGRTPQLPADPPGDLDQATLRRRCHPAGAADDLLALLVAEPLEPRAPVDLVAVGLDEPGQARLEEAHLGPAVDQEPAGDQPLPPPPGDRPGRHVVPLADFLDRQDRLGGLLHGLAERGREVLDVEPEVGPEPRALQDQRRGHLGPEPGDPEEQVLERVASLRLDLAEELFGPVDLLDQPLPGREPRLLIPEFLQRRMAISAAHPVAPDPGRTRPVSTPGDPGPTVVDPQGIRPGPELLNAPTRTSKTRATLGKIRTRAPRSASKKWDRVLTERPGLPKPTQVDESSGPRG